MRKILHVIDSLDLGGAQTLLLDLCRHADRSRFEVEVAFMHGPGVFAVEFEKAGIPVHVLSPSTWPPKYIPNFPSPVTPLTTCEERDPKGLYKSARAGLISKFTGIDSPYEPPLNPEIEVPTQQFSVDDAVTLLKASLDEFREKS